jgi:hypothetical protein
VISAPTSRFPERVRDHGADEIVRLLQRRWEASFGGAHRPAPPHRRRGRPSSSTGSGASARGRREGCAALVGLGLLAVIGLLANDSRSPSPVMLAVAVPIHPALRCLAHRTVAPLRRVHRASADRRPGVQVTPS